MLNGRAYAFHYKQLDSVAHYAHLALQVSEDYGEGKAEALNHLAFVAIARMDYDSAKIWVDEAEKATDNQIELLVTDVQRMRLCQRKAHNKDFYTFRERAAHRIQRIREEADLLSPHQQCRWIYAVTEYHIVSSTYFYYVGLFAQASQEMADLKATGFTEEDPIQHLNFLYNVGSGGVLQEGTPQAIRQEEFEYLMRCYLLAQEEECPFFEAQALQGIGEQLCNPEVRHWLIADNPSRIRLLNSDDVPDSLLAGNLAERALQLFRTYGDVYQVAGGLRTLASCYWELHDYKHAIQCLEYALHGDTVVQRAPSLVASIHEQLSLAYSAIDDKASSDYHRNCYLDLQDVSRQDHQLEARAEQLRSITAILNGMMIAVGAMIVLVVLLLAIFAVMRRRADRSHTAADLLAPLQAWRNRVAVEVAQREEAIEDIAERTEVVKAQLNHEQHRHIEQRAKVNLAESIMPFIDRIIHEIKQLDSHQDDAQTKERLHYIAELTDNINDSNQVLTRWIKLRQGQVDLHVESFALQELFSLVEKGRTAYRLKGVTLQVVPTQAVVKADKALTLFMINTLADNARKFTPAGGSVRLTAQQEADYVEVSVADTGCGMDAQQQSRLFAHRPVLDEQGSLQEEKSHGFGLMNCKGIIEKYKKTSRLFACCDIGAESNGQGSRFWFRLPIGVGRLLLFLFVSISFFMPSSLLAQPNDTLADVPDAITEAWKKCRQYADSAYYSNIDGKYHHTLVMADSCLASLNRCYHYWRPNGVDYLVLFSGDGDEGAELKWFQDSLVIDYTALLNLRNEVAVAALALHDWELYHYNNRLYTQLFRAYSADATLPDYVRDMQRSEMNKRVAIILLVLLLCFLFPAYYLLYYRHRLAYSYCVESVQRINAILDEGGSAQEMLQRIDAEWKKSAWVTDSRLEALTILVKEIRTALEKAVVTDRYWYERMEIASDELRRRAYEQASLHVANNVLDNCLSALKHETMYYPSRIRALVDAVPCDIHALQEITVYYRALYDMLCRQARRQVAQPLRPTEETLSYLLDLLRQCGGNGGMVVKKEGQLGYQCLMVLLPKLALTEEQCRQLFTPATIDLRFLVCRQIVREIGEAYHARGCGIAAYPEVEGVGVRILLPLTFSVCCLENKNKTV